MKKPLFFLRLMLALWLVCIEPACAQNLGALPVAVESFKAPSLTATDTIAAIQKVFRNRRLGGTLLIGTSAIVVGGLSVAASDDNGKGLFPDRGVVAALMAVCTSPAWVPGTIKEIRFNHKREQKIIAEYQRSHHLPAFLRKIIANGKFNKQSKFILFPHHSDFR